MAKKKKRRIQAPSLSGLDKGLYYFLIACFIAAGLFLYPAIVGNYRRFVFQDPKILAQDNLGIGILVFLGLILGGGMAALLYSLRLKKQPIFGKKNFEYGPPKWKPIYPVFSKQFWNIVQKDKKQFSVSVSLFLMIVLIVLIVTSLALPPRECLLDDGSVQIYNCFNENTDTYNASDVTQVRIYTREFRDRRGIDDWGIEVEITMRDGEDYFFSFRDFKTRDENIHGSITGMYQIKASFDPSIVLVEGEENLQYVIRDMNLNQQETELLYALFGQNAP